MYKPLGNINNKIDEIGGKSTDHHMNMHCSCEENTYVHCSYLDSFKGNINGDVRSLCDPVFGNMLASQEDRTFLLIEIRN